MIKYDTTWRKEFLEERQRQGDNSVVVAIAPESLDLDREFDPGYGGTEGTPFAIWTEDRVYFPAQYDGSEWVESVPRGPNGKPISHVGGG